MLSIPRKRHTRPLIDFLIRQEIEALLAAPSRRTWIGQRDHAFLLLAVQTGLRLSELTGCVNKMSHSAPLRMCVVLAKGEKKGLRF